MKILYISVLFHLILITNILHSENKNITITIDDLPYVTIIQDSTIVHTMISKIIQTIDKFNINPVGFVITDKFHPQSKTLSLNNAIMNLWVNSGIELGSHSYSHLEYNTSSFEEMKQDIIKGEEYFYKFTKRHSRYYRQPMLHRGNTQEKLDSFIVLLKSLNLIEAPVTIDNCDYIFARAYDYAILNNNDSLKQAIGKEYVNYMIEVIHYYEKQSIKLFGRNICQILLMHANSLNADYLPDLLNRIISDGYNFISLNEALNDNAYKHTDKFIGKSGISWIHRWALTDGKTKDFFSGEPDAPEWIYKESRLDY